MGKKVWVLSTLEKRLIEEGIKNFKPKDNLINFLKKHPHLFGVTILQDTFVWSLENKEENGNISTRKNPDSCSERPHLY